MKLNENIVNTFNNFLKIKNPLRPTKTSIVRYDFLFKYFIQNKTMTVRHYQLCSTHISKDLGVSVTVVRKWIRKLQELKIITCTNPNYKINHRSKEYFFTDFGRELVNEFNGFKETEQKHILKKKYRDEKWSKFNKYCYDFSKCIYLTSSYLGCPDSLVKDIKERIPVEILEIPRENNINEAKFMDFFYAYNHVVKAHNYLGSNYKKLKKSEFVKLIEDNFGETDLTFNLGVVERFSNHITNSLKYNLRYVIEFIHYGKRDNPKETKRMRRTAKALKKLISMKKYDESKQQGYFVNYDNIINNRYLINWKCNEMVN